MYYPLMKLGIESDQNNSKEIKERPRFARPSAQALPSLYMCDTTNLILLNLNRQLFHLFLKPRGTTEIDLEAKITS